MPKVEMNMPEPPDGREWTGDVEWLGGGVFRAAVRRVRPSTVTVELPRDVAEALALHAGHKSDSCLDKLSEAGIACRAALEKEKKS